MTKNMHWNLCWTHQVMILLLFLIKTAALNIYHILIIGLKKQKGEHSYDFWRYQSLLSQLISILWIRKQRPQRN